MPHDVLAKVMFQSELIHGTVFTKTKRFRLNTARRQTSFSWQQPVVTGPVDLVCDSSVTSGKQLGSTEPVCPFLQPSDAN
jgi:hypothetical protein